MENDKLKRIQKIKEEIDNIKENKSRLTGEISGNQKHLQELEKELFEKHSIKPKEIVDTIKKLEEESETALKEAESILKL